jgi:hypothetical protein
MNDHKSDRSQGDYEQFRTFQQEAQARATSVSALRPSDLEAIQRIGRLFTDFRISHDLDHRTVSERSGVPIETLRLLEHGFLTSAELTSDFLKQVGAAFVSRVDRLIEEEGGMFASIAGSMLEAGIWVGSDAANAEVDALISSLGSSVGKSVREEAAWTLGDHVLNPRARDALANTLTSDEFTDARLAAMESLAALLDDPAIRSLFLEMLSDPDSAVSSRAKEIVTGSMLQHQPSLARALTRLLDATGQISEAMLDRFKLAMALVPSFSMGIQMRPRVEGAASQGVIGEAVASEYYSLDMSTIGAYPEFGLVLGITFVDAQQWAGHFVRVQFDSHVDGELRSAGWRVDWVGLGPDVVDSETPVSVFGRVEMLLGKASLSESPVVGSFEHHLLESLVAVIARSLSHEDALSSLNQLG